MTKSQTSSSASVNEPEAETLSIILCPYEWDSQEQEWRSHECDCEDHPSVLQSFTRSCSRQSHEWVKDCEHHQSQSQQFQELLNLGLLGVPFPHSLIHDSIVWSLAQDWRVIERVWDPSTSRMPILIKDGHSCDCGWRIQESLCIHLLSRFIQFFHPYSHHLVIPRVRRIGFTGDECFMIDPCFNECVLAPDEARINEWWLLDSHTIPVLDDRKVWNSRDGINWVRTQSIIHWNYDEGSSLFQAVTKDLTSSSKFSGSCVLTLQTLPLNSLPHAHASSCWWSHERSWVSERSVSVDHQSPFIPGHHLFHSWVHEWGRLMMVRNGWSSVHTPNFIVRWSYDHELDELGIVWRMQLFLELIRHSWNPLLSQAHPHANL